MRKIYTILFIVSCTVNGALAQTLWAWGTNISGELGNGTTTSSDWGKQGQISTETNWMDIDGGYHYSVALKSDGTIWAWGENEYGSLGDGTTTDSYIPKQTGTDNDWTDIEVGYHCTMALKKDGTLWRWGTDDTDFHSNVPVQFGTDTDWKSIASGWNHAFGIKTDGTLWAWGSGNLGNDGLIKSNVPVQIGTDIWQTVAAGENYSVGIKSDGTLWGWGVNGAGQTGTTGGVKKIPTQVGTEANWATITCGQKHTVAIKTDGSMWSWGYAGVGLLGDGTSKDRNTPVQIGTSTDWAYVAAGLDFTMALKTNGTIWAFGYGRALGYMYSVAETPTQIGTDKWSKVGVGNSHTLAIGTSSTTAGVNDIIAAYGVNVYPNPNAGKFYLKAPDVLKGKTVIITDMLGAPVSTFEIAGATTEVPGSLSSGVYFLKAENTVIKIVVE